MDGFCHHHAVELEDEMAEQSPLEAVSATIASWFGGGRRERAQVQQMIDAGMQWGQEQLRSRFPGVPAPEIPGQPPRPVAPPPPRQAPPRGRVAPEAIAARKQNIAARGILGFEPDEPLTEQAVKDRRRDLARVWHTDNAAGAKDPTREAMMRKINAAADLLIQAARAPR